MGSTWLAVAFVLIIVFGPTPVVSNELALTRVMLSSGGVAYFEHEAEVSGDSELKLDVPLEAVDDVLKSIVVYDSNGGVGGASLPGRNPLAHAFNNLPFGPEAMASPAALLNALQGVEIKVGSSHPITGKVLTVLPETVQLPERGTLTRNRVTVLTSSGLQQFILEEAETLSFADADLQAKVNNTLTEIAAHRGKGGRQITLTTRGFGNRVVRVGYVVAAPLWKASFRLTLPHAGETNKAHVQGWAVLENMSGQDWHNVELTLMSGNPVSFRQALYQAYYVARPEVPVEVIGRVLPTPDSGALGPLKEARNARNEDQQRRALSEESRSTTRQLAIAGHPSPPAPAAGLEQAKSAPSHPVNTAEAEEAATEVVFRLPVKVTLSSGQSAIVPIVDRDMPVDRLSLSQPGNGATHPLASLRLRNDSNAGLPPGVLTLYEETAAGTTYVGDARLTPLPAGEDRLLSYAVDEKTKIVREDQQSNAITKASIAQGVLKLTNTQRHTTVYKIAAPASEPRTLIIDHDKQNGFALAQPQGAGVDETASAYRLTVELKSGEGKKVMVVLERPELETLSMGDIDEHKIAEVTASRGVDPAIKKALAELEALRRSLDDKKAVAEQVKNDVEALAADQVRIRENLSRIDKDSSLHKRYMEKLTDEEAEFEALKAQAAKAAEEIRAATAKVDAFIAHIGI
jgi:hypothetical protein